jgi:signal transduction histidine kinase
MQEVKATILYIEDDPGSQRLVERALQFAGYRVLVASRGIDGIDLALQEHPDLILMDINLPDLSGREVTTRLRAVPAFRDLPIVALTAQSHRGEREKSLVAGCTGYLTKPVDIDKLPTQVADFLGGEQETLTAEVAEQVNIAYNQELVTRLESKIRELEEANQELRRLDKVKENFIQLTAHELRTPLTVIQGYSQLLQGGGGLERIAADHADVASMIIGLVDSIDRLGGVIAEIVAVSRFTSGRIELSLGPLNLEEAIEKAVEKYALACRERSITLELPEADWHVRLHADGTLLTLVFSNLLSNAVKYTPDGGTVTVSVENMDKRVKIAIRDTGIGIDADEQQRIFDRFYTAGDTQLHSTSKTAFMGGGLGLGLAISKAVIEQHGGMIWAESEGRDETTMPGSTFSVLLPKVSPTVAFVQGKPVRRKQEGDE